MRQQFWTGAALALITLAVTLLGHPGRPQAEETYTMDGFSVEGTVTATAASPDGARVLFAGEDGTVTILAADTKQQAASISWPGVTVYAARFSPDGASVLLFTPDKGSGIWDAASGQNRVMLAASEPLASLSWSPDGTRLSGPGQSGTLHVFDAATGKEVSSLATASGETVLAAELDPGNARLLVSGGRAAQIRNVTGSGAGLTLTRADRINNAHWSPDGKQIVLALNNDTAELVDAASGAVTLTLRGHTDDVLDARFSPDGKRLVTGSEDDTARIWNAADGSLAATLPGHLAEVARAEFTADGARVITYANDVRVRIWSPAVAGSLPDGAEGLWTYAFEGMDEIPDEVLRVSCLTQPVVIGANGLAVFFQQAGDNEPPQATHTMRCEANGRCKMFPGLPGQAQEAFGEAAFSLKDKRASFCSADQCILLDRCKPVVWTDEEKASGLAAAWETQVLGAVK